MGGCHAHRSTSPHSPPRPSPASTSGPCDPPRPRATTTSRSSRTARGRNGWFAPRTLAAGAALEAETALLDSLRHYVTTGVLSFAVPDVVGYALLPEGGRAVVHHRFEGSLSTSTRSGRAGACRRPRTRPRRSARAAAVRRGERRPARLHGRRVPRPAARRGGRGGEDRQGAREAPAPVGGRLEDVSLWKYQPVVVHGDLGAGQVLVARGRVVAVTDWAEARVADPPTTSRGCSSRPRPRRSTRSWRRTSCAAPSSPTRT
ncbi:hypothetical protein NKG05_03820 [Oerskovia sp. M15]